MTAHVIGQLEATAAQAGSQLSEAVSVVNGVFHTTGTGETTWFGFAEKVVEEARLLEPHVKLARVEPIPASEYPTPARRPVNSRLDCEKLERTFRWRIPDWNESTRQVVSQLVQTP